MTDHVRTAEEMVRDRLAEALGGRRGVVEAAIPTIVFTVLFVSTGRLRLALVVSITATVLLLVVRLAQRSTVQFVLNALIGIGIAAVFASRSGEARDVFLPGILYNAGYAALMLFSIAVGWPLVGLFIGSLTGELTEWRRDRSMVRLCAVLTALMAAPCVLRVAVQYPLWAADEVALLGTAKVLMGWPLQVGAFVAMGWLLSRNRSPVDEGTPTSGSTSPCEPGSETDPSQDPRST